MLLDLLSQYLEELEAAVRELENAYVESYEEEILAANRVNLRIRVRFQTGYLSSEGGIQYSSLSNREPAKYRRTSREPLLVGSKPERRSPKP